MTLKSFFSKSGYTKNLLVAFIFTLGVIVFYGNTLQNGFVHDDHGLIETNTYLHSLKYLPKVITSCIWESANGTCKDSVNYRPILSLSFLLTYQISPQPWIFHLMNLLYFAVSIFLIFVLVKLLTKNPFIAFFSGFIFLIHPLNTEVVNWVAASQESLMTIFALLATIYYLLYRERQKAGYLKFVYLFYTLSLFSKEPGLLLPLIFLSLDFIFFKQKISSFLKWKNLQPYIVLTIILSIYMLLRFWALGSLIANSTYSQTYNLTVFQYVFVVIQLFGSYIKAAFWPYPLNYFHTFNPSFQFWDLNCLTDVLVTIGFLGTLLMAWKRKWTTVLFAVIWFFVFLFPSVAFVNSIGDNKVAERHLFTPLIGFSVVAAIALNWLKNHLKRGKTVVYGLLAIISLISFLYIFNHNKVWKNDISLDIDTLKNSPDADLIRYNLALEYLNQKDTTLAKEQLTQIIKDNRWYNLFRVYYTLAGIYRLEGKYNEALSNYRTSITKNPAYKDAYNNIGAMSLENGNYIESVLYLCKAMQLDPNFTNANTNFNVAASRIQGLDNKSFISLYDQILQGGIFEQSKAAVKLEKKDCSYPQGCLLSFSGLPKDGLLFPFLILGKTESNEIVRNRYFESNPQNSEFAIGIDRQFGESNIHFWFPVCNGIYYEAEIK